MEREWGNIEPENGMLLREWIGSATTTDDNGTRYNLELSFSLGGRCPVVRCEETHKVFILPWKHILALAEEAGVLRPHDTPTPVHKNIADKLFLTEIINDLHRNGFMSGGKAQVLLQDWARELRAKTRRHFPASRLRRKHAEIVGRELW